MGQGGSERQQMGFGVCPFGSVNNCKRLGALFTLESWIDPLSSSFPLYTLLYFHRPSTLIAEHRPDSRRNC